MVGPGRPDWLRGSLAAVAPQGAAAGTARRARGLSPRISHPAVEPEGRERNTQRGRGWRHLLGWAGNQKEESHQRLGTGNLLFGNLGGTDTPAQRDFEGKGKLNVDAFW